MERGEERTDVGFIDVQIVGWRSVAVVACGWNNVPNWVVVVVVAAPDAGSNIGLNLDEPNDTLWKEGWRLNDDNDRLSIIGFSSFSLLPNHRCRIDGTRITSINTINAIKRTIQNIATTVFVKIRVWNICGSIIVYSNLMINDNFLITHYIV